MPRPVKIAAVSTFFPEKTRSNHDFDFVAAGVDAQWPEKNGLKLRHVAADHQNIIDLAFAAADRALNQQSIPRAEVGLLILVSSTFRQEQLVPTGVVELQQKLGLTQCMSLFLTETCCGSLMAMEVAASAILSHWTDHALIVAAETFSKTFNPDTPMTYQIGMSMGDGAGAILLSAQSQGDGALIASHFESSADFRSGLAVKPHIHHGKGSQQATLRFGFGNVPPSYQGQFLHPEQVIAEIKRFTISTVPVAIEKIIHKAELTTEDIDFFVLHQPNRRFLDAWRTAAEIPPEKTLDTLHRYGNLSSVSVIANLEEAALTGRLQQGDKVLLAAVGEGANWGAMLWSWHLAAPLQPRPPATVESALVTIENYSMLELWEKFIIPNTKDEVPTDQIFCDFVPSMAVFERVPLQDAYDFIANTYNMNRWTLSMRRLEEIEPGLFQGDEDATPTGKIFIRAEHDPQNHLITWRCGHESPQDLWIVYKGFLVDAMPSLGRPGTAFFWTNFVHQRVKEDPQLRFGFKCMYAAHALEMANLKAILEHESPLIT